MSTATSPRLSCINPRGPIGSGGQAYFLTDGETPVFKNFINAYVAPQGFTVPERSVSPPMAKRVASVMEFTSKLFRLNGHQPLYKGLVNTLGLEFITSDQRARQEIGYRGFVRI